MKVYDYPFDEGMAAMLPRLVNEIEENGVLGFVIDSEVLGRGLAARIRKACEDVGIEVGYDCANLLEAEVFAVFRAPLGYRAQDLLRECEREARESGLLEGRG